MPQDPIFAPEPGREHRQERREPREFSGNVPAKGPNVVTLSMKEQRDILNILSLARLELARYWASGGVLSGQDALLTVTGLLGKYVKVDPSLPSDFMAVGTLQTRIVQRYDERIAALKLHFELYKSFYKEVFDHDLIEAL